MGLNPFHTLFSCLVPKFHLPLSFPLCMYEQDESVVKPYAVYWIIHFPFSRGDNKTPHGGCSLSSPTKDMKSIVDPA